MPSTSGTPKGEGGRGLSQNENSRGRSKEHESICRGKTIMGETSYSLMKGLQPKNLMQRDTALAPPSQEQSEQKVSPLNHDGELNDNGMRGLLHVGSMRTAGKIQVPFTNSRERVKKRMRELEAVMQDLRRRMATTSKENSKDDELNEESPFLREIQMELLPPNLKEPRMTSYDGTLTQNTI
uniref:Uncharacterized protein n=1 Tax=Cannabis sativa TaxID=3483 RepID=A0A803P459_CANSA